MRKDLFKKYKEPKQVIDLKEGDYVWGVMYSKFPNVGKYKVTKIGHSLDKTFLHFELELIRDYSIEGPGWRRYSGWWWEKNHFEIDLNQYNENSLIVCSKRYRGIKFFSDERVMKYSLGSFMRRIRKDQRGRIKRIQENIDYLDKFKNQI